MEYYLAKKIKNHIKSVVTTVGKITMVAGTPVVLV